ncbi:MAG: alpha/beta hydrolase [Steroidobacteraceae bacterium]
MPDLATVVIVPGLREHVADHWQTLLEARLKRTRNVVAVPTLPRSNLSCNERVEALQETLGNIAGAVLLVAHSGGVATLVHWAARHSRAEIIGALLAAPADLETPLPEGYPSLPSLRDKGWLPLPRVRLPFRSIVAASSNDPLASLTRVEQMASAWGSDCVYIGAVGHLNPASGYGEWLQADDFIARLDRTSL